jgi:hypothetical protein
LNVFNLSFLDAMTCGLGAVVLLYMVINASVQQRAARLTDDLRSEVDRAQNQVFESNRRLVELRNSLRETSQTRETAQGLSRRLLQTVEQVEAELATFDDSTIARREHISRLQADLRSLEEEARRLSAASPSDETPGDRLRVHIGDGDRQYLTGLKVGGDRILFLVDASASMLGDTVVNIIRRRNLPDDRKILADKWQQAVATIDWLSTQIPRSSRFQLYTFSEAARPVVEGTDGEWLDGGDRETVDGAVQALRAVVPARGTNLYHGLSSVQRFQPLPDNLILLVDGLPTQGRAASRSPTVSARQRARLFERAVRGLPAGIPVNVILFPMEGDPVAASAFWKLAQATGGSFMSLSEDWP